MPNRRRLTLTEHAMIVLALDRAAVSPLGAGSKELTQLADYLRDARIVLWVEIPD